MSEHTSRLLSLNEPAFAPLRRQDLASFLVLLSDGRVVAATSACAALGVTEDAPAPASVAAIARHVAALPGHTPRLERVRLPSAFVPRVFSCLALTTPIGPVVLFADPAAMAEAPPPPAAPAATVEPEPPPARPVRFTWEADGEGRILSLSASFIEALGPRLRAWQGRTFSDLAADGVLKDTARVSDMLMGGATFSDAVLWTGEDPPRRIEIGGVPLFDAARRRIGVRGFGLIWQAPPRPPAPPRAPENVVPLRGGALSPRERTAFHEIARSLNEAIDNWPKPAPVASPSQDAPRTDAPVEHEPPPPETRREEPIAYAPQPSAPLPEPVPAPVVPQPAAAPVEQTSWQDGLLDRLPIGLAVQQRGAIVHVNETLLEWVGTPDADAFRDAGGLGRLLVRGGDGRLELKSLAGPGRSVDVRLLSAPWRGQTAIIHTLRALEPLPPPPPPPVAPPPPVVIAPQVDVAAERARGRAEALDVIPFPVFLLDASGIIEEMNTAAAELCGFTATELKGEPFTLTFAPGSQVDAVALLDAAVESPDDAAPREGALRARHRLGIETELDALIVRAVRGSGRYCLILREPKERADDGALAAHPATRRPETRVAAADADLSVAMEPFVRRVSHAVRVPLTSIMGFVDAVRGSTFGPVGNNRYAKQAEAAAIAAQQLLASLADIEALNAAAAVDPRTSVDVSVATRLALDHVQASAKRRRVLLRGDMADDLDAWFNPAILDEGLRLLLEEAVQATPAGGQVLVSSRRADPATHAGVVILVRDGGRGLSEEEIAIALSPFKTAAVSDRFTGSGRPFRMARLAALMQANGAQLRLRRGVEMGMLCEIHLPD
ncbi:PAS domain-containing protein [Aquabacter cavernae]|uniref:PAS domain-containing protein n=1 Tax=Aquabacter cavernae TaxID=2496029 RepID=UPI000F8DFB0A|nr:PAS domain-containing protein [Aquabacter cavernae]